MRERITRAVGLGAMVLLLMAAELPVSAAMNARTPASGPPAGATAALIHPLPTAATGATTVRPLAQGENPLGRVSQTPGDAGYEAPTGSTVTVSTVVTVPTL